ncbi:hypothetical protein MMC13_006102 [Lambiella insularis]|nr:hypothetical protein [Lambiella insularis]
MDRDSYIATVSNCHKKKRTKFHHFQQDFIGGKTAESTFPELHSLSAKNGEVVQAQLNRKRRESARQNAQRRVGLAYGAQTHTTEARIQQTTQLRNRNSASVPWKRVIWVGFPDNPAPWNMKESKSLCTEILGSNREMAGMDWLDDNDISNLEYGLGSFYSKAKDQIKFHLGLVTMLIANSLSSVPIELHSWRWLEKQLREDAMGLRSHLTDSHRAPIPAVIILHCTTTKPSNLFDVCCQIESLPKELSIRSYPKASELSQDQEKHDWMILDKIAQSSGIVEYRFRPKTCSGKGPCLLHHQDVTVMKREHSSGGAHIAYQVEADRGYLQCDLHVQPAKKKSDPEGYHWFHQEYMASLNSSEFLVNIAMESHTEGLGLRGRVVQKVTTTRYCNKNILSRAFEASDLETEDCWGNTEEKLDHFALWIVDRLLELAHALDLIESLQVGVRLDIGFCHGSPFVSEIGGPYNAHFFSISGSAEPFTKMAKAVATSLLRYLGLLKSQQC